MSNLRPFGNKCIEESTTVLWKILVTLLGLSGDPAVIQRPHSNSAPQSNSAPGELRPLCPPRYVPDRDVIRNHNRVSQGSVKIVNKDGV